MSSPFGPSTNRLMLCLSLSLLLLATACSKKVDEERTSSVGDSAPAAKILRDGVSFAANPDPIPGEGNPKLGITTITWKAPVRSVEIHLKSPDGQLWGQGGGSGSGTTGKWVTDGMTFYLQDGTAPNPKDASATMAVLSVPVK